MKRDWAHRATQLQPETRAFVGGEYVIPVEGGVLETRSPIDGRRLPGFSLCSEADVDFAVHAARSAVNDGRWTSLSVGRRKQVLLRFAGLIQANAEELSLLDAVSMGKPVTGCLNVDVPLAVECYRWFAEAADKLYDEALPFQGSGFGTVMREPLGVVGCIAPWNYPAENLAWKLAPALAAGNTVVLKPSEQATLGALMLGRLANEAGIPPGVLNIVPGLGPVAGQALALHGDVDGIYFTGSTAVGKKLLGYAGRSNMKRVSLETGGKSAFVVLATCGRLQEAAQVLARNIFINQGQTCSAPSRLIVDAAVHDELMDHLIALVPRYAPGDPLRPETRVGAMVSHHALERVEALIRSGVDEGATLVTGGQRVMPVEGGAYMSPTVFDDVRSDMRIAQEEVFGPVLSVITVSGVDEAVTVANDSIYGLSAAVWTDDYDSAIRVSRRLHAGSVYVNGWGGGGINAPFGGFKQSGFGHKEKSLHAFDAYTQMKTTWFHMR